MVSPARRAALRVLQSVGTSGSDLGTALERERTPLADPRDRALTSELTLGVLRWRAALDHVIAWAGQRAPADFDAPVLDILRLGTYQLLHLTRVPASAAVHDAVDQCREAGFSHAAAAVNAILRGISRKRGDIPWPSPEDHLAHVSVTLSHPVWLAGRWLARLGAERAATWAAFNNEPAPVVIRAHTWSEQRESLASWLAEQGIATTPTRFAPDGLVVTAGGPVSEATGLGRRFTVQDESSQLVAAFVGARPGERVLDVCAAPGGKTTALAGTCGATGLVVGCDLRPRRLRLLRQTVARTDVPGVLIVQADATASPAFGPRFDAVLVDVPCSGLGTIRRDPDIRWRRTEADLPALAEVQWRMLVAASAAVRPGGRLVYATCSSEPDENEAVVERFLAEHGAWRLESGASPAAGLSRGVLECLDDAGRLAPCPDRHRLEPFFACRLRAPA